MRRMRPGQSLRELTAADWNEMAALADRLRETRDNNSVDQVWSYPWVSVKNTSGADRKRGEILGISGPVVDWDDSANDIGPPIFTGVTPTSPTYLGRFAVCLEPIANATGSIPGIGRAALFGMVRAKVNVTDANHRWADITDGDCTKLTSRDIGAAQIVAVKSGTGTKWAWVRVGLPGHRPRTATLDSTLTGTGTAPATLDDGRSITVRCRLIGTTGTIARTTKCEVVPLPNDTAWLIIASTC